MTVSPARGTLSLAAGGQARQPVEISVSGDVPRGVLTVPVVVGDLTASVRLNVAARGTPEWHHNNAGIGDADAPGEANIDGPGFSLSAQALAEAGLTPGARVKWRDFTFTWPDRKRGEWDNVRTGEEPLEVAAPDGATRLSFLGTGVNGWPEADVTVTYTDGTTSSGKLGFSDWILDFGSAEPRFGNEVVARTPHRLFWGSWAFQPVPAHVYASQPIALDPGKKVRSLTFSTPRDGRLHLFTWAFA
ncbi:hypothetical protein [Nonomuraea recticatena]|uniref:hypothetical protein n=1 Tax=Nonomuraea recticatena TaxID=46178 RepID=UPI0036214F10